MSCFKESWPVHSQKHLKLKDKIDKSKADFNDDKDDLDGGLSGYVDGQIPTFDTDANHGGNNWEDIFKDSKTYVPVKEDVGRILRVECRALTPNGETLAGPIVVYTEPVLGAPRMPPRRGLHTIPGAASAASSTLQRFRIMSYNILAEIYATKQAYPYCDSWSLAWPYRRTIIIQELQDSMSDIICLQEVQADSYENDLLPALSSLGYEGIFKQKTRESMGQYGKVDGCATFWKRSKFLLVENYSIEFNECVVRTASHLGLEDPDRHRFISRMCKDNIAQVLVFEVLPRNSRTRMSNHICVVNTHLYSNHLRPEIKLWQSYTLLREIEDYIINQELALFICGDFNSEPDSAVYGYLARGCCSEEHDSLVDEVCRSLGNIDHFVHNLDLASAMGSSFGVEPQFTNYTKSFKGTLDYMWYTPGRLKILAVTDLPNESDICEHGEALPSVSYPSDHLMLCCDVALLSNGTSVRNPHAMSRGSRMNRGGMGISHNNSSSSLSGMRSPSPGIKIGGKASGRR